MKPIYFSIFIYMISLMGCDTKSATTESLIDGYKSYQSYWEVSESITTEARIIGNKNKILWVDIPKYKYLDTYGELHLVFCKDRLVSTTFFPEKDFSWNKFDSIWHLNYDSASLPSEVKRGNLVLRISNSILDKDEFYEQKDRIYIQWADDRLVKEIEANIW